MDAYDICVDFLESFAGTSNTITKEYMETKVALEKDDSSLKYISKYAASIADLAEKKGARDGRISKSKGNIKNMECYKHIETVMEFLEKFMKNNSTVKRYASIKKALEEYQPLYTEAYSKKVYMAIYEYEIAADTLITGLSYTLACSMEIDIKDDRIVTKFANKEHGGVIEKISDKLAKELTNPKHKKYLDDMINAKDNVPVNNELKESYTITESVAEEILGLVKSVFQVGGTLIKGVPLMVKAFKQSWFGIAPLIRSMLYFRYKKKADTIVALEDQAKFIENNIEQLQNMTKIDPEKKETIIKRQKAIVEAYKKKAEKLRAELIETEKDTSKGLNADDEAMRDMSDNDADDEFVLEASVYMND